MKMTKKPILIIEQYFNNNCMHIMVRIDNKAQIKYLLNFCNRFIKSGKNKKILKGDFNDIYWLDKEIIFSHRVSDKSCQLSYLVIDEGKKVKTAFIYVVVNSTKEYFKRIKSYWAEDYFEL